MFEERLAVCLETKNPTVPPVKPGETAIKIFRKLKTSMNRRQDLLKEHQEKFEKTGGKLEEVLGRKRDLEREQRQRLSEIVKVNESRTQAAAEIREALSYDVK